MHCFYVVHRVHSFECCRFNLILVAFVCLFWFFSTFPLQNWSNEVPSLSTMDVATTLRPLSLYRIPSHWIALRMLFLNHCWLGRRSLAQWLWSLCVQCIDSYGSMLRGSQSMLDVLALVLLMTIQTADRLQCLIRIHFDRFVRPYVIDERISFNRLWISEHQEFKKWLSHRLKCDLRKVKNVAI